MKIHQLPMGARFEYAGEEYVKTAPLFGSNASGRRLIPKSAILRPLDGPVAAPRALPDTVDAARVLAAFEVFAAHCRDLVPEDRRAALESAREAFLSSLENE